MNRIIKNYKIINKRFLLLLLISLVIFDNFDVYASENSNDKIKVGYCYFSGFSEIDENGNYSGYGYEYYQQISKYTGWEYEFVVAPFSECMEMLKNGEIDLMGHQQYSEEREKIYDYSTLNAGVFYTAMYIRADDNRYFYQDYESFDEMTVGIIKNSIQDKHMRKLCKDKNFSVEIKYYDGQEELVQALEDKKVDAIVTTALKKSGDRKMVAKFYPSSFYFVTTKGNNDVLNKLNYSMEQVKLSNPSFEYELYNKYFAGIDEEKYTYTKDEMQFIEESPSIKIAYVKNRMPIEYYDEKSKIFSGITADIFEMISSTTGLKFTYIESENFEDALNKIYLGQVDAVANFSKNYKLANNLNLNLSEVFLNSPYLLIRNKDVSDDDLKLVIYNSTKHSPFIPKNSDMIYKGSPRESFDMLKSGKADAIYVNTYIANEQMLENEYSEFSVTTLASYSDESCIAVSKSCDSRLLTILNKAIYRITAEKLNDIIISNTMKPRELTLSNIIYQKPVEFIFFFSAFFIIVLGSLCYIIFLKSKNNKNIKKILYLDSLTGYWNFNKFREKGDMLLKQNNKPDYALLYININNFKYINDTFGYAVGDKILSELSDELYSFIFSEEMFARVSADKFVMLLKYNNKSKLESRINVLDRIIEGISYSPMENYKYTVVVGIYILQPDDDDITSVIDWANIAKETAEISHKNVFVYYDEKIIDDIKYKRKMEERMEISLRLGEFIPFLQPQFNVLTKQITGAEALTRWINPEFGMISPNDFIPLFEKNGFIISLDFYIFEEVCKLIRRWIDDGITPVPISCNFSRKHLLDKKFPQRLEDIRKKYSIPVKYLEVEVTESIVINETRVLEQISMLKSLGFVLAIDDFGTGYSSLGTLKTLPMDVIKLDKNFLQKSISDEKEKIILQGIVSIAKGLNMQVVCEGVEYQKQADILKEIGCDLAQGFLYAKPMKIEDFEKKFNK